MGSGPGVINNRLYWEGDLFGNNNYQGGAANSGDAYTASQFGMSGITFVNVMGRSASGNYCPAAIFSANSQSNNESYAPAPANFGLRWYSANGTEAANNANLATEVARAQIFGI